MSKQTSFKKLFILFAFSAIISTAAAQKQITDQYQKNCDKTLVTRSDPYQPCTGSQACCTFKGGETYKRCMSSEQRAGKQSGTYIGESSKYQWTCQKSADATGTNTKSGTTADATGTNTKSGTTANETDTKAKSGTTANETDTKAKSGTTANETDTKAKAGTTANETDTKPKSVTTANETDTKAISGTIANKTGKPGDDSPQTFQSLQTQIVKSFKPCKSTNFDSISKNEPCSFSQAIYVSELVIDDRALASPSFTQNEVICVQATLNQNFLDDLSKIPSVNNNKPSIIIGSCKQLGYEMRIHNNFQPLDNNTQNAQYSLAYYNSTYVNETASEWSSRRQYANITLYGQGLPLSTSFVSYSTPDEFSAFLMTISTILVVVLIISHIVHYRQSIEVTKGYKAIIQRERRAAAMEELKIQ